MTLKTAHAFASAGLDPGLADTAGGGEGGGYILAPFPLLPCPALWFANWSKLEDSNYLTY